MRFSADNQSTVPQNFTPTVTAVAAAALLLPLPLAVAAFEIYLGNLTEFTFRGTAMLPPVLAGWAMVSAAAVVCGLALRKTRWGTLFTAALIGISGMLWMQYSVLFEYFRRLSPQYETCFDWLLIAFDVLLLVLPLAAAVKFRCFVARHAVRIALVVAAAQLLPPVRELICSEDSKYDFVDYNITEKRKFEFGSTDNVIVVVVDCMGEALFKATLEKYPECRRLFRDFTCFDRMVSPVPRTVFAVPALLTGVESHGSPESGNSEAHARYLHDACRDPGSVFAKLHQIGYSCEAYPYILQTVSFSPDVIDNSEPRTASANSYSSFVELWCFRLLPFTFRSLCGDFVMRMTDHFVEPCEETVVPASFEDDGNWDKRFLNALNCHAMTGSRPRVFKYYHLKGAHFPLNTDARLQKAPGSSHVDQLRGSLRCLEALLGKLRELDLYDRSLIVITGDHTERYTPEIVSLVKRPGDRHDAMQINSAPGRISDLAATIGKAAECKETPFGRSMFDRAEVAAATTVRQPPPAMSLRCGKWRCSPGSFLPEDRFLNPRTGAELTGKELLLTRLVPEGFKVDSFEFAAENLETGTIYTSLAPAPGGSAVIDDCRVGMDGLPPGNYRVFFLLEYSAIARASAVDEDSKPVKNSEFSYLTEFLAVSENHLPKLIGQLPVAAPRNLKSGETVRFTPLFNDGAFEIPQDCTMQPGGLYLKPEDTLKIHPPTGTGELQISLDFTVYTLLPGEMEIRIGRHKIWGGNNENGNDVRMQATVPVGKDPMELKVIFWPRYPNRAKKQQPPKVVLHSLRCDRSAGR